MKKRISKTLARNLLIEILIYAALLVAYVLAFLKLLGEPLARLFDNNLFAYAFVGLVLIVAQGVLLDFLTSFIINQFKLDRLE